MHPLAAYDITKTSVHTDSAPAECIKNTLQATCKAVRYTGLSLARGFVAEAESLDARETTHTWCENQPCKGLRPPLLLK